MVLADRSPDWLADFIDRHLKHQFGIAAWPLARALVRLGAIPRPDVPEYATLMPNGVTWHAHEGNAQVQTPLQALRADAGLLEDEIWRLFTVPEAGKALADIDGRHEWLEEAGCVKPRDTWATALAELSADGRIDRDRLLDACLGAFTRDFHPKRVSWYAGLLELLEPTTAEIAARMQTYLGLLAANSKSGVTVAQHRARTLLEADLLDPSAFLTASAPLCRSRKRASLSHS